MRENLGFLVAVLGSALTALSLIGSTQAPANSPNNIEPSAAAAIRQSFTAARRQFSAGHYLEAHESFLATASLAQRSGSLLIAAEAFNDAGASALARQDIRHALPDFLRARHSAEALHDATVIAGAMNNLASLYNTSGHPEVARQVATQALAASAGVKDKGTRPKLQVQLAIALAKLNRFPEALVLYRDAVDQLVEQGDPGTGARVLSMLGGAAIEAGHSDDAEVALDEALWMIRSQHLPESSNVLRFLAKIRGQRGDQRSAMVLFDAAIKVPVTANTPQWIVFADRGEFRLSQNDAAGALLDFREARRLIVLTRADIVPADRDRVAMESGLSRVPTGLAEAGNRLALQTSSRKYLEEAFNAAEEDRLWSLRALVPSANDWRTRLPANYWDILAQYQAAERSFLAQPSPALRGRATALGLELQHLEAAAGSSEIAIAPGAQPAAPAFRKSALAHAQSALEPDSVLLSFLMTKRGGWLWVVDRNHACVYPVPALQTLQSETAGFSDALRKGNPEAARLGRTIFKQLFGEVPESLLAHKRWLLELDGPLFDLPFAALVISGGAPGSNNPPVYLTERVALQAIPGALLLGAPSGPDPDDAGGEMLAVGDAVYNAADARFNGNRGNNGRNAPAASLARLPATASEIRECARTWGPSRTRVLAGSGASLAAVESAIASGPSIIHFATHVVAGPDDFSSGLIALSLDPSGSMGLLGPTEIVAHPVTAALVVLNGCHSAQGQTLPAAGLMGLTRAWIGAGAGAVLATRWDIPDDAGTTLIAAFYRELKTHWERGPAYALQLAEIELLKKPGARANPALLASYFLIGRV